MPKFRLKISNGSGDQKERIGIPSGSKEELVGVYEASDFMVDEIYEMSDEEVAAFEAETMANELSVDSLKGVKIPPGGLMLDENNQPIQTPPQQMGASNGEQINESELVGVDNEAYANTLLKQNYALGNPEDFIQGGDALVSSRVGNVQADVSVLPTPMQASPLVPQPVQVKPRFFKRGGMKFKQIGEELYIEEYVEVDKASYKIQFDEEQLQDILGEAYDRLGPGIDNILSGAIKLSILDWVKADEEDEVDDGAV